MKIMAGFSPKKILLGYQCLLNLPNLTKTKSTRLHVRRTLKNLQEVLINKTAATVWETTEPLLAGQKQGLSLGAHWLPVSGNAADHDSWSWEKGSTRPVWTLMLDANDLQNNGLLYARASEEMVLTPLKCVESL